MGDDDFVRWVGRSEAEAAERHFLESSGSTLARLAAFPRFVDRSSISRFLVKYEIFKIVMSVQGSIFECGVHDGGGIFSFAQFSALLEPLNHRRRIVGFDTFQGFPSVHANDVSTGSPVAVEGNYSGASLAELETAREIFDRSRSLSHIPKVEFVKGDFIETGPKYLVDNPQLIVSLLYLDFDLYEPTKLALELFYPRVPTGGVIAFDQTNSRDFPGESQALLDYFDLPSTSLQRFPTTSISWIVVDGSERGRS